MSAATEVSSTCDRTLSHRPAKRYSLWRVMIVSLGGASVAGGLIYEAWRPSRTELMTAEQVALNFCAPVPPESKVLSNDRPTREVGVIVPAEPPPMGAITGGSVEAGKGQIVSFVVSTSRSGAVGVHGLSEIEAIHAGATTRVTFRAIYSGRFPLHFHGTDGSHFELAAVEVRDRDVQVSGGDH